VQSNEADRGAGPWKPEDATWTIGTQGIGWILYVPLRGNENTQVRSHEQRAPRREGSSPSPLWVWDGVITDGGTPLDIRVTMSVELSGSSLAARLRIDNQSGAVVDSAVFPHIRGIEVPADRSLDAITRDYFGGVRRRLWPVFSWNKPYYGTEHPTLMTDSLVFGNPVAPFVVMTDGIESLAAFVHSGDPAITSWMWELTPGYGDSLGDHVPEQDTGLDPQLTFSAVHLLNLPGGQSRDLIPVQLTHARGEWQNALLSYRELRSALHDVSVSRDAGWGHEPRSWYQVQLNSPAGEQRFRFEDVPELAAECLRNGVDVLHLIGWNEGGQDRNNPNHQPDPALGGMEGLQGAIAQCQELGVKVVLFSKFTWADESTEWFRNSLHTSAIRNPYGDYYVNPGYAYLTPHQLLGVNTRRLIPMCFQDEAFIEVCEAEFDTLLATGADGTLFDEAMHHTPALLCFASNHGHPPGTSAYAGDHELIARLRSRIPEGRPFLIAGETVYEDLQRDYDVSYIRSHYQDHFPLSRFVSPKLRMMTTVSGFDDRNQINQAIVYGYLLCYEPKHFKGRLTDFPRTVSYGQLADDFRTEFREFLWDGEYQGDAAVSIPPRTPAVTSVWRSPDGASMALIANYDPDRAATVDPDDRWTEYRLLEDTWQRIGGAINVPPRSLLILR